LFALIVIINGYIIAAPFLPRVSFWWRANHSTERAHLNAIIHQAAPVSKTNSLIIPSIMLNAPTLEGPESNWSNLLKQGIWRWPSSSTPDKGGNTVLLAHRFSYTGPHGAFYYLDKLKIGDEIGVIWNGKTYTYSVISSTEVSPTDTAIENNTSDARLTLFTCTPLWSPKDRLVVVATLEKSS
jgi:LPXTG-site transpeptidase (sortase) family protein